MGVDFRHGASGFQFSHQTRAAQTPTVIKRMRPKGSKQLIHISLLVKRVHSEIRCRHIIDTRSSGVIDHFNCRTLISLLTQLSNCLYAASATFLVVSHIHFISRLWCIRVCYEFALSNFAFIICVRGNFDRLIVKTKIV